MRPLSATAGRSAPFSKALQEGYGALTEAEEQELLKELGRLGKELRAVEEGVKAAQRKSKDA
jgi:hypothetical protein